MAPLILNLVTEWRRMVRFTPPSGCLKNVYPAGNRTQIVHPVAWSVSGCEAVGVSS